MMKLPRNGQNDTPKFRIAKGALYCLAKRDNGQKKKLGEVTGETSVWDPFYCFNLTRQND